MLFVQSLSYLFTYCNYSGCSCRPTVEVIPVQSARVVSYINASYTLVKSYPIVVGFTCSTRSLTHLELLI
jgi:hypothetical protein